MSIENNHSYSDSSFHYIPSTPGNNSSNNYGFVNISSEQSLKGGDTESSNFSMDTTPSMEVENDYANKNNGGWEVRKKRSPKQKNTDYYNKNLQIEEIAVGGNKSYAAKAKEALDLPPSSPIDKQERDLALRIRIAEQQVGGVQIVQRGDFIGPNDVFEDPDFSMAKSRGQKRQVFQRNQKLRDIGTMGRMKGKMGFSNKHYPTIVNVDAQKKYNSFKQAEIWTVEKELDTIDEGIELLGKGFSANAIDDMRRECIRYIKNQCYKGKTINISKIKQKEIEAMTPKERTALINSCEPKQTNSGAWAKWDKIHRQNEIVGNHDTREAVLDTNKKQPIEFLKQLNESNPATQAREKTAFKLQTREAKKQRQQVQEVGAKMEEVKQLEKERTSEISYESGEMIMTPKSRQKFTKTQRIEKVRATREERRLKKLTKIASTPKGSAFVNKQGENKEINITKDVLVKNIGDEIQQKPLAGAAVKRDAIAVAKSKWIQRGNGGEPEWMRHYRKGYKTPHMRTNVNKPNGKGPVAGMKKLQGHLVSRDKNLAVSRYKFNCDWHPETIKRELREAEISEMIERDGIEMI